MKCPNCKNNIFQKQDDKIKLRTNIIVFEKSNSEGFEDSTAMIKCPCCKGEIKVPLFLDTNNAQIKHLIINK